MIEMLLLAMILSGVTLKAAGNAAVDVAFAVRGKESPRLSKAKARSWTPKRPSGPAFRYFSQLWADSWEQRLTKHNAKVAGGRLDKPRGAARVFWSGVGQDMRRAGLRKWDQGWTRLDEKRRSRSAQVPDGTDVVPGEVVPEPPVPAEPEPVLVDVPEGGTDRTDPSGTRSCPICDGALAVDGEICGACQYRQKQRNEYHDQQADLAKDCRNCHGDNRVAFGSLRHTHDEYCVIPEPRDGIHPGDAHIERFGGVRPIRVDMPEPEHYPTPEGTPTMTTNAMSATPGDLVALDPMISYCEGSVIAHREQIVVIERAIAGLAAGDDTSAAVGFFNQAMEANSTALSAMESAAAELRKEKAIQEQYDAVQGAGTREYITGGR